MRFINGSDAVNGEFADTNTLENIMAKLSRTIRDVFDSIPRATRGHWRDVLLTFTGGNPKFDRGYYFYGLLDCAAQLGRYLDPDDLPKELRSELRTIKESLLSTPCDSVFRLKAVSISGLLSLIASSTTNLAHCSTRLNFTLRIHRNEKNDAKI